MLRSSPFAETTFTHRIGVRAHSHPDRPALTFIGDDGNTVATWTYRELWLRCGAVADALRQQGAVRDSAECANDGSTQSRALLLYPPGLEFVAAAIGCQIAGWIPVPTCYPRPGRSIPRLDSAARDCHPQAILCDQHTSAGIDESRLCDEASGLIRIETDTLAVPFITRHMGSLTDSPESLSVSPDALAFLQYTSGSTSEPKGVMVRHRNLMANLMAIQTAFRLDDYDSDASRFDTSVFWLPFYHDMGLVGGIFASLYLGYHAVLHSPRSFLQRPIQWLSLISKHRAVISGAPNFAYQLCVDRVSPEQTDTLDLSGWKTAFCGAEPILARTLSDFGNRFAQCGFSDAAFYPCYGLAEATLLAAGGAGPNVPKVLTVDRASLGLGRAKLVDSRPARPIPRSQTQDLVCCGRAALGMELEIVDPQTRRPVAEGTVGEVWIRGSSIASGYWNRPEENRERFNATITRGLFSRSMAGEESTYFRTGDLGFLHEGELYVTGRLKDTIIVRGRNHYPQDIEATVREAIQDAGTRSAAFSVPAPRGESLAVVVEVPRHADSAGFPELVRSIRRQIIDTHDIDPRHVWLVRVASVPVTTSGKIQRSKCRSMFDSGEFATHHRYDRASASEQTPIAITPLPSHPTKSDRPVIHAAVEAWLVEWLVARAGVDPRDIAVEKPFSDYGLDSMTAVELSGELEDWTGIELTPIVAWNHPSVQAMSHFISDSLCGIAELEPNAEPSEIASLERDS